VFNRISFLNQIPGSAKGDMGRQLHFRCGDFFDPGVDAGFASEENGSWRKRPSQAVSK
jgi:hypothetical protein